MCIFSYLLETPKTWADGPRFARWVPEYLNYRSLISHYKQICKDQKPPGVGIKNGRLSRLSTRGQTLSSWGASAQSLLQIIIRVTICLPVRLISAIKRIDWTSPLEQSRKCGENQFVRALLIIICGRRMSACCSISFSASWIRRRTRPSTSGSRTGNGSIIRAIGGSRARRCPSVRRTSAPCTGNSDPKRRTRASLVSSRA